MKQKELPGFHLDLMEISAWKKSHVFRSIMSDISHLGVLTTQLKTSSSWERLAENRTNYPLIYDQVLEVIESF